MVERDPYVVSRPVGDGYVLIPLRREDGRLEENMLQLSGVAARIWELLEEPRAVDDLVARLLDEYEVTHEQLSSDVTAFLDRLAQLQGVSLQPSPPGKTG